MFDCFANNFWGSPPIGLMARKWPNLSNELSITLILEYLRSLWTNIIFMSLRDQKCIQSILMFLSDDQIESRPTPQLVRHNQWPYHWLRTVSSALTEPSPRHNHWYIDMYWIAFMNNKCRPYIAGQAMPSITATASAVGPTLSHTNRKWESLLTLSVTGISQHFNLANYSLSTHVVVRQTWSWFALVWPDSAGWPTYCQWTNFNYH